MTSETSGIRLSVIGRLLVGLTGLVLFACLPGPASAAGTGSISGTLKLGDGPPFVPSMCVSGVSVFNRAGHLVDSVSFGNGGSYPPVSTGYMLNNLDGGGTQYRLQANLSCTWLPTDSFLSTEYFRDKESLAEAIPITVRTGSAISGIDIYMDSPDPEVPAPDTVIDSGPSDTVTTDEATFEFTSTDPANTVGFECRLDAGDFTDCVSPKVYSSLSDGSHTFSVRAKHAVAGIEDQTPATRTFAVDTAGPSKLEARISKVFAKGPAKVKRGKLATFKVKVTNSGNTGATGVKVKINGAAITFTPRAGTIPAGSTKTIKVKVKLRRRGNTRMTFKVTSSNAGSATTKRRIFVKK